jgi:hypothetical protein
MEADPGGDDYRKRLASATDHNVRGPLSHVTGMGKLHGLPSSLAHFSVRSTPSMMQSEFGSGQQVPDSSSAAHASFIAKAEFELSVSGAPRSSTNSANNRT